MFRGWILRSGGEEWSVASNQRTIKRERPICSHEGCQIGLSIVVRSVGLEPTHLAALDPKSNASTNSATTAARFASAKVRIIFELASVRVTKAGEPAQTPRLDATERSL